jgi:hypothetical protein
LWVHCDAVHTSAAGTCRYNACGFKHPIKTGQNIKQTELGCVWSWPWVNMRGDFVSHIIWRTRWHTQTIWHSWRKSWVFLVLVCANTKRNYAHLHDPDAFFARPVYSVDPCHVSVEFCTRPIPFKLILISCLLCLFLTTDFPPFRFSTQLFYAIGFYPVHATFSTHLFLLVFTTLIIFSWKQILRSSSFYNSPPPQLPVTSCLLYHYPLSSRFLNTLNTIYLFMKKKHTFNEEHSKSYDVLTAVSNEITVFKCDWVCFVTMLNSDVSVLTRNSEYRVYFSTLNTKAPGFEER